MIIGSRKCTRILLVNLIKKIIGANIWSNSLTLYFHLLMLSMMWRVLNTFADTLQPEKSDIIPYFSYQAS